MSYLKMLNLMRKSKEINEESEQVIKRNGGTKMRSNVKLEEQSQNERVALNEKRLLAVSEFQKYASIGRNNALRLAHESGAAMRIGRRLLIDRVKFDQWCDEQC